MFWTAQKFALFFYRVILNCFVVFQQLDLFCCQASTPYQRNCEMSREKWRECPSLTLSLTACTHTYCKWKVPGCYVYSMYLYSIAPEVKGPRAPLCVQHVLYPIWRKVPGLYVYSMYSITPGVKGPRALHVYSMTSIAPEEKGPRRYVYSMYSIAPEDKGSRALCVQHVLYRT